VPSPFGDVVFAILPMLAALLVPGGAAAQGCSVPHTYGHRATVAVGDLLVTLATDQETYSIGDPVHFWLSFENTGNLPVTIPNPNSITPMDGILVLPAACDSLEQAGCEGAWLFMVPQWVLMWGVPVVLSPGSCAAYEHTWDGLPRSGHTISPGPYTVLGGMISGSFRFHTPPGGIRLPIQLQSPSVPVTPTTWGTIKAKYSG
jgi:hypothetical protein